MDLADSMMDMCVGDLTDLARQVWGKRVSPLRSSQMTRTARSQWQIQVGGKSKQKAKAKADPYGMTNEKSMICKKSNMVDLTGEVP